MAETRDKFCFTTGYIDIAECSYDSECVIIAEAVDKINKMADGSFSR